MEHFKYSLDKSSKKYVCPNCNKKTFVLYTDTDTGNYLTDYGRCDREQNCSYHKAPPKGKKAYLIDYLVLKSISAKAYKLTDLNGIISIIPKSQLLEQNKCGCWVTEWYLKTSSINYSANPFKYFNTDEVNLTNEVNHTAPLQTVKPSFHNLDLLNKMYSTLQPDNFSKFLKSRFSTDEVRTATQKYFITGTNYFWNDATVFWQIDNREQIHAGKIMLYDCYTGRRVKEPYNCINWLHKALKEPDFSLCQCLFGLHRINEDYLKTIAIVESEKTAVIMSIILPDYIWLATGSKGNFKAELLEPIKKRTVIAFPDKGEYKNWSDKANVLNAEGYKIAVSEIVEQTDFENGFDIADYFMG